MSKWIKKGLKFSCTGCGKCCTGGPGYVFVTHEEIEKIASHLNLTIEEFSKKYLRKINNKLSLTEKKHYDCVFLKDKACQIYPVRPKQCSSYPFWNQILASKENWEEEKKVCEGIDQGELISIKSIQERKT